MPLYRFGSALIRLERVVSIRTVPPSPEAPEGKVRVYFERCRAIDFDGPEAEAVRRFMGEQPLPPRPDEAVAPDQGRQAARLDPSTGRPLANPGRRGGKDVTTR